MIFQEKKTETGYNYKVEDVFGTVVIDSEAKMTGELLDDVVLLLLKQNIRAETIDGEVKHEDGIIKYNFTKAPMWSEDDEEDICKTKDTYTSTKKQESVYVRILKPMTQTLDWLRRFVVAFQEAYKKTKQ